MIFSCRYSSKARYVVASKDAALDFEKRDGQLLVLLALVSVFERKETICEGLADSVLPQLGQRYEMVREAMRVHTFLPSRMLLAGGERGACTFW